MKVIKKYPYGQSDPHAMVELIAYTGVVSNKFSEDDMPVLAARVSHANNGKTGDDPDSDLKLMNFLVNKKHWSTFQHQYVTFKVVAPLFVIREMQRHKMDFNEISMRYSSDPVGDFYFPANWRTQETRNKQSSAWCYKAAEKSFRCP